MSAGLYRRCFLCYKALQKYPMASILMLSLSKNNASREWAVLQCWRLSWPSWPRWPRRPPFAMVPLVIWLYNCFSPKLTHIPSFARGKISVSLPETGNNQIGLPKPNALRRTPLEDQFGAKIEYGAISSMFPMSHGVTKIPDGITIDVNIV